MQDDRKPKSAVWTKTAGFTMLLGLLLLASVGHFIFSPEFRENHWGSVAKMMIVGVNATMIVWIMVKIIFAQAVASIWRANLAIAVALFVECYLLYISTQLRSSQALTLPWETQATFLIASFGMVFFGASAVVKR